MSRAAIRHRERPRHTPATARRPRGDATHQTGYLTLQSAFRTLTRLAMQAYRLVALMLMVPATHGPGATGDTRLGPPLELHSSISDIRNCGQLIAVTSKSWSDRSATIQLFERASGKPQSWQGVEKPFSAVIGMRGFGWGIGLHGTGEPGAPRKREGDQRSPAGVFKLSSVFGFAEPAQVRFLRLPYHQVTAGTEAIDDPRSKYYNRVVDRATIARPDWSSSESMLRVGGRYRYGVTIQHNWPPVPGFGSCIFLHVWDDDRRGTAGCTATSSAHLDRLLHRLDSQKNPLIVQLPQPEYVRLKESWGLP